MTEADLGLLGIVVLLGVCVTLVLLRWWPPSASLLAGLAAACLVWFLQT